MKQITLEDLQAAILVQAHEVQALRQDVEHLTKLIEAFSATKSGQAGEALYDRYQDVVDE